MRKIHMTVFTMAQVILQERVIQTTDIVMGITTEHETVATFPLLFYLWILVPNATERAPTSCFKLCRIR
ncbi:unnamed protein product [Schistosoma rodhaini]|uniref:Uncharacterized protein n=1 Tax=Schistosoma rodhaini TaxID=6188 RepID=A0AA85GH26_9TREM|nr:unnamed protein product [Schistosoma rodhaini]